MEEEVLLARGESAIRDSNGEAKASGLGLAWNRVVEFIVLYISLSDPL